ncbi:ComEC/Rec2 family competence protein [Sediminicola luteus]|uniref:ComEC/Rec2-related protein domain-containing protein n=1 Tax=Sediminicola luteus TaxID=319238 RepID=A0A2A4GDL2_9FLAO|nr:ComEC/Rec2 family competence protein [Sediminicola luteus]PCE65875.1 hypothetical protein B7P33_00820 [Sediminicola luteus]
MPQKRWISVWLCGLLILGILIGYMYQPRFAFNLTLTIIAISGLGIAYGLSKKQRNSRIFLPLFIVSGIALGMLSLVLQTELNAPAFFGNALTNSDTYWKLQIRSVLKNSAYSSSYLSQVIQRDDQNTQGTLLLKLPAGSALEIDQEIEVIGRADSIAPSLFPYSFDYKKFMAQRDVYFQLKPAKSHFRVLPTHNPSFSGKLSRFRQRLMKNLEQQPIGNTELGVIKALLLGERKDLSPDTYSEYQKAGAVHLLAVSGLHIGVVLWLLHWLLRPLELLPKGRYWIMGSSLVFIWGYAFLAGLSPSILRATLMFSFLTYAFYSGRITNTYNIVALSAFFTLLLWPRMLFELGFQLSYAAVLAIATFYKPLLALWKPKYILVDKGWQLLVIGFAAQLGVLPLSLFYFHQFPGLFFVSNLIIVPAMGLVLGLGFVVLVLSAFQILPQALAIMYHYLIYGMNQVVFWVAQQEAFLFTDIHFDGPKLVLGYCCILLLIPLLYFKRPKHYRRFLLAVLCWQSYAVISLYLDSQQRESYIWHQFKKPQLISRSGLHYTLYSPDSLPPYGVPDLLVAQQGVSLTHKPLENLYQQDDIQLLRLDRAAIVPQASAQPLILWLSDSPRVHLEKVLDSLNPIQVVADGSNYPGYVRRWKATCKQRKTPFHHTNEKGVFRIEN